MKVFTGMILFASAFLSFGAHADLTCGDQATVPSEFVSDLRNPACIGVDSRAALAVVSGGSEAGLETRAIRLDRRGRGVEIVRSLTVEQTEKDTVPYYAFSRNCGLALITSRIVDDGEVLLIFDNLTVVRWNWSNPHPRVVALASKYDPKAFYLCYGIEAGVDTMAENIDFDPGMGTLTVHSEWQGGGSVTVRF